MVDGTEQLDVAALKALERRNRDAGAREVRATYETGESRAEAQREDRLIRQLLRPKSSWTVLDAGCGIGRYSLALAGQVSRVIAVDFSEASMNRLLATAEQRGLDNIEGIASDLCALSLPAASVDGAISVEVLQHIPGEAERATAVQAIAGALKPGAPFVLTAIAWNRRAEKPRDGFWGTGERRIWRHHFEHEEMRSLLSENGFERVHTAHFHALPRRVLRRLPTWSSGVASTFDFLSRPLHIGTHLVAWGTRRAE